MKTEGKNIEQPTSNAEHRSVLYDAVEEDAAESPADFVHKLRICLKELRETRRWLLLVQRVPLIDRPTALSPVLNETEQLIRIFVASIRTAEKRPASKDHTPS